MPRIIRNNEATEFDEMEEEEYEFDILWDNSKQLWTTVLRNGAYLINAKAKGYKELNEYIEIGKREFKFVCTPAS